MAIKIINNKVFKVYAILGGIGGISILISFFVPFSLCLFYNITGLPCPACGLSRAYLALFNGDFSSAFNYNALFPIIPFIPLLMSDKLPRFFSFISKISTLALLLGYGIFRIILYL